MTNAEMQRAQKLAPLLMEMLDVCEEIRDRLKRIRYEGPIDIVADEDMLQAANRVAKCKERRGHAERSQRR